MKIQTANLTGIALDWAVSRIEAPDLAAEALRLFRCEGAHGLYAWSTDWNAAGEIIHRMRIHICPITLNGHKVTQAWIDGRSDRYTGQTPTIAAMRCYVASVLGSEIDVPVEFGSITCQSVLGGWQSQFQAHDSAEGFVFGPVFNAVTDLWAWQRENLFSQPSTGA